jgi:nitrous oxide reductase accessory protein NosL
MKTLVLMTCLAALAMAACRREEAQPMFEPMKLGGNAASHAQR